MRKIWNPIFYTIACFILSACDYHPRPQIQVDFQDTLASHSTSEIKLNQPIYVGIASMTSPKETLNKYTPLIDYLSVKLNQSLFIKQKKTYKEVNELLKRGEVDIAFIGAGSYVELSMDNDVTLLVVPVIQATTKTRSYIITYNNIGVNKFANLKDKRFAFSDPQSISGYVYPKKLLKDMNTHERIFFHKTIFTYSNDISIHMVNRNVLDGAAVQGLIFEELALEHPENINNITVLHKSEPFTNPPVVAPKQLDKYTFDKYQSILTHMNEDSAGRQVLKNLHIDRYVILADSAYDNSRKLKKYVEDKNH